MEKNNKINIVKIEKELKKSYLEYATSVIISRALPDIRDGLKPVHRRILYAMYILDNHFNKPYKKSARIVGDVIGKYHPHGDNAVYDSIVRMAQKFSLRYVLIDGQGNFGSIDGDSAAAMRYTEIRMSEITKEFLKDIDKKTVSFLDNYDYSEKIPEVLPTRIPNILINGTSGIAVGMITNIPPHNIIEVMNALIVFIKHKKIKTKLLMKYIKGPDFPTGGIIENYKGIYDAYKTGKGIIKIKAKIKIEYISNTKNNIIIYELPYQVNKTKLIEKIIELIKNKKINEISNIRDESNKKGMRILLETKKDKNHNLIINKLFYLTNLEISYRINIIALYKQKPRTLNLKKIFKIFIEYRKKIIKNKTLFKLNLLNKKIHILEGFLIILPHINKILYIIKKSKKSKNVQNKLSKIKWLINNNLIKNIFIEKKKYILSKKQIKSILNLTLNKLTKIEQKKIIEKYFLFKKKILLLNNILSNKKQLEKIIIKEFFYIKKKFGDKRFTDINKDLKIIKTKDLIKKEKVIITLSKLGYIKYQKISNYEIQHRGGKGKLATKIKKKDFIKHILITDTHKKILFFSNKGKSFLIKVYKLPKYDRYSKGIPIINIIKLEKNEKITNLISFSKYKLFNNIIMVTKKGLIKKINIKSININKYNIGLNIIKLKKNDELVEVYFSNKDEEIMLFTKLGKAVRFSEKYIRSMGKKAHGIKGIKLSQNDKVVSLLKINENKNKEILIITKKGYGKRTLINEFPIKARATKGIIFIKINNKNGYVIRVIQINYNDQIFIITNIGNLVRIPVCEINVLKRNTQGVILIRKKNKLEKIVDVQKIKNFNLTYK